MTHAHAPTRKTAPIDQIAAVNQRALTQAARTQMKMLRDMMLLQSHVLAFAARRLQRDIAAAERLADCGDAPEMVIAAQTLCAEAMSDYADEAAGFLRLTAKLANGGVRTDLAAAAE